MTIHRYAALLPALSLLIFIGCSKIDSKLIGKWQNVNLNEVVEFHKDKTGVIGVSGKPPLTFRWTVLADDRLRLEVDVMGKPRTLTGKLDKETFVLELDQMNAVYRKISN